MTDWTGGAVTALAQDAHHATLVGRAWDADAGGPVVVAVRDGIVIDLSGTFATMRDVSEAPDPAAALCAAAQGPRSGKRWRALVANTPVRRAQTQRRPWLLSPIDLHVVKAAGVTFPVSDARAHHRGAAPAAKRDAAAGHPHHRASPPSEADLQGLDARVSLRRCDSKACSSPRGSGASTSRSESGRTPRSSPKHR